MQKWQILEAILEQQDAVHKDGWNIRMAGTSRRPNIVTSQRRDVESTYKEVNKRQRRDAPTSRRSNVATLQRCNVATSTRVSPLNH